LDFLCELYYNARIHEHQVINSVELAFLIYKEFLKII